MCHPGNEGGGAFCHVLGGLGAAPGQPVLDEAHAPCHAEGVAVGHIRLGALQGGENVLGEHFLNAVEKANVPPRAQQSGADVPVGKENGKDILQKVQIAPLEPPGEGGLHGVEDLVIQFLFHAFQHVGNVPVVEVEGGTVDVHQLHQLGDRHLVDALLPHQLGQPLAQQSPGAPHPAVWFSLHTPSPTL